MADHYGSSEVIAGRFRSEHPDRPVQLLTKWVPEPGVGSRQDVRAAVERALERTRSDAIDLLQFHAWRYSDPAWLDCIFELDELRREGLIRHLGVTNFDTAHLAMLLHSGIPIVSNQVCFSLLDRRARRSMLDLCLAHDVKLLAFGTVAGGLLTERWLGASDPGDIEGLETWSQMKYARFVEAAGGWAPYQQLLRAVKSVADRHGVSMANVACRAVLEEPGVGGVIIGARLGASEHIRDNLRLFSFELDDTDRTELDEALSALDPIPGDCGDEYRKPPFLTASGDLTHHFDSAPPPYTVRPDERGDRILSGTIWEEIAGFSRAIRRGDRVLVSGTTATHGHRCIGGGDPASQMHFILDKVEGALQSVGGSLADVVRTRIYVRNEADWEPVSRAHGARFGAVGPANTLIRAEPIGDEYLVEMEAEAILS
jgi:aryl-alcohol dehydrogenase-like predicted oxidoreductase/enamine deaminase RidA (YjgF/YER057c/UK114 family)